MAIYILNYLKKKIKINLSNLIYCILLILLFLQMRFSVNTDKQCIKNVDALFSFNFYGFKFLVAFIDFLGFQTSLKVFLVHILHYSTV